MRRIALAALGLGLFAAPTPTLAAGLAAGAPAQGEVAERARAKVGVLPLVIVGEAAHEIGDARDRLSASVHEAFSHSSYDAVLLETDDAGDAETPYCATPVCWQMFADEHDVTHFLVVVVNYVEPDYRVDARLIDGRTGESIGVKRDGCDLCGITELAEHVQDVAAAMRREVEATLTLPPRLFVDSVPPGAQVLVDGDVVGVTPVEVQTLAGSREIEVRHPDYVTERFEVDLAAGVRRELKAKLRKLPKTPTARNGPAEDMTQGTLLLGLGAGTMAVGAGLVAGGAIMIAIDRQPIERDCTGNNVDALGRCRYLHDTKNAGVGVLVGGILALGGGIVMAVLGGRARKASKREARVGVGGRGLTLSGRF
jgi:hypothetical protein